MQCAEPQFLMQVVWTLHLEGMDQWTKLTLIIYSFHDHVLLRNYLDVHKNNNAIDPETATVTRILSNRQAVESWSVEPLIFS